MLLGPTEVRACPHCETPFARPTLLSGNTFGATYWTDGSRDAPMMPEQQLIGRCRGCNSLFWIQRTRFLGTFGGLDFPVDLMKKREDAPQAWQEARPPAPPSAEDFREAVETGLAEDRDAELLLRRCAWWADNDTWRREYVHEPPPQPTRDADALANLQTLHDMLDPGVLDERLFKLEAARHLGRFEEARALLDFAFPAELAGWVEQQRQLIAERDVRVRMRLDGGHGGGPGESPP